MKLLTLKIENKDGFRSLQQGFEIKFHNLEDTDAMEQFRPFCFAGLNGSGKSNVLEALSAIFYHLEFLVAAFQPKDFSKHFDRRKSNPDAYRLEYLIGEKFGVPGATNMTKVCITKKEGEEPEMEVEQNSSWLEGNQMKDKISLIPSSNKRESASGKRYLPDNIVAYSSGENETLSIPYIKCRLVHYDEYVDAITLGLKEYKEPENSFIYIDSNMSQAVLLANLIFEDVKVEDEANGERYGALRSFSEEIGIEGLQRFRMNINLQGLDRIPERVADSYEKYFKKNESKKLVIVQLLTERIKQLKNCATCFYETETELALDFFVNDATKIAFKTYFTNQFELFQLFRLLYELNAYSVDEYVKDEVYKSKGFYTDWKLPQLVPKDNIFAFSDFFILKKNKGDVVAHPRLLKEFSDGEHQFIHTMGICMMLKKRRALLLLDEPETHFNPAWRAKFIKILNDSIAASSPMSVEKLGVGESEINIHPAAGNLEYYVQKEVLLTSHSPFIISDCLPDNVILFEKDNQGNTTAKKASELGIDTYGTSVNILTNRIFSNKETIGKYVLSKLNELRRKSKETENKEELIDEINRQFGDSIEKLLLIKEISGKE